MKWFDEAPSPGPNYTVHPTAIVDSTAAVGDDTVIWHYAHVMGEAQIGSRCMLGQGVHVGPGVKIGDGCRIQNGAQLFEGVTLENGVFIGPHVVFSNVLLPRAFAKHASAFSPTLVQRGVTIGANATILCGITIGEYAMIGAGSVVTKNVGAYLVWYGNPARPSGHAVCRCGVVLRREVIGGGLPEIVELPPCTACGAVYTYSYKTQRIAPI